MATRRQMNNYNPKQYPKSALKGDEFPIPFEGPPVFIVLEGHMDRDGSITFISIESCWPKEHNAKRHIETILACKHQVIREQYSKSLYRPNKWEDATGNFLEIQKHEVRIPHWMNEPEDLHNAIVWFATLRV
jgi:hypothetical protein